VLVTNSNGMSQLWVVASLQLLKPIHARSSLDSAQRRAAGGPALAAWCTGHAPVFAFNFQQQQCCFMCFRQAELRRLTIV
jgi:hypothetical protein